MKLKSAKLWVFVNCGWVKLRLHPGRLYRWYRCQEHDEGWSSEYQSWEFDGEFVTRVQTDDGRDCDGRLSETYVANCHFFRLAADPRPLMEDRLSSEMRLKTGDRTEVIMAPDWRIIHHGQRDYSAERMGY